MSVFGSNSEAKKVPQQVNVRGPANPVSALEKHCAGRIEDRGFRSGARPIRPRFCCSAVVYGGRIVVMGGMKDGVPLETVERYSPKRMR